MHEGLLDGCVDAPYPFVKHFKSLPIRVSPDVNSFSSALCTVGSRLANFDEHRLMSSFPELLFPEIYNCGILEGQYVSFNMSFLQLPKRIRLNEIFGVAQWP